MNEDDLSPIDRLPAGVRDLMHALRESGFDTLTPRQAGQERMPKRPTVFIISKSDQDAERLLQWAEENVRQEVRITVSGRRIKFEVMW